MLMLILIVPVAVHAHTLALLGTETNHAVGAGCHDTDNDTGQGSNDNQQFDAHCCELDTPYVLPSSQLLLAPACAGTLACTFNGRQLDGYSKRVYKPPR
jgi:hypothetical protein